MSFNFIHFFIFWKFLVPPGGTAGPLATPLSVCRCKVLKKVNSCSMMPYEQSVALKVEKKKNKAAEIVHHVPGAHFQRLVTGLFRFIYNAGPNISQIIRKNQTLAHPSTC